MEPELEPSSDELQRRVLQHTLEEVATRQDEEDVTECCVICLEGVSEACQAIPCKHRNFDYLCLVSWLEQSPQCPLCKTTVAKVLYGFNEQAAKTYIVPRPAPRPAPVQASTVRRHFNHGRRQPRRRQDRDEPVGEQRADEALERRRNVYRRSLFSKHVGSNRISRYHELTPQMFCADGDLVSRARMWIRRELQVFAFLSIIEATDGVSRPHDTSAQNATQRRRANNAEFLLEYIIAILKSVDMMGSRGQAEDMLADFLGRGNTKLFLHELRAWLRSPFTKLEDWDRAVQYDEETQMRRERDETGRDGIIARSPTERHRMRASHDDERNLYRKGDFYRPSTAGPSRRQTPSSRHAPYRSRNARRDRS